ncbi:MAG: MBL fold metallo-hydrolase [Chloroflexi bacterium]|nr:MBL fold metallo-hydrolase [Chloroflexota bacterium]
MAKQIIPNLYRIGIPLPGSPLKAVNCYLIKGGKRFLLIDTGWNQRECKDKMLCELGALGVDLNKTDIFITHLHADHCGLAADLATRTSTVYINDVEAFAVNLESDRKRENDQELNEVFTRNGYPEEELKRSLESHPGRVHGLSRRIDFEILREGDALRIGDYSFRAVATPGHSLGHMCLYEAKMKVLVAGDHILSDITPNIAFTLRIQNPLKKYLESLEKIRSMDIGLVLPGHRRTIDDHKARIGELREHHRHRLTEVLSALKDGDKTAYEIAPFITWNIGFSSWELFPYPPKRFAFGETLAHLKYLEEEGSVRQRTWQDKILFSLV